MCVYIVLMHDSLSGQRLSKEHNLGIVELIEVLKNKNK